MAYCECDKVRNVIEVLDYFGVGSGSNPKKLRKFWGKVSRETYFLLDLVMAKRVIKNFKTSLSRCEDIKKIVNQKMSCVRTHSAFQSFNLRTLWI